MKKTNENKVWYAGKAPQEELDEIDRCRLCEKFPWYEKTCRAVKYCHRQLTMFDTAARDEKRKEQKDAYSEVR